MTTTTGTNSQATSAGVNGDLMATTPWPTTEPAAETGYPTLTLVSFGYLHGPVPEAHLVVDLRKHFRDPHVDPALRYLTAHDEAVRRAVRETSGIFWLEGALTETCMAFLTSAVFTSAVVAVGCQGGRHRAPSVVLDVAAQLADTYQVDTQILHRDLDKEVVER